ncbi:fibronectin type III domain-containing protein [Corticibacter populi]|uniref:fibronectin type III domain-containing protein n=1 Tax=Corticibacter populi TaxID=1550736 RepID=UPI00102D00C4|nr:fibronectin type III domain-containing protein [Corticibacter populi]
MRVKMRRLCAALALAGVCTSAAAAPAVAAVAAAWTSAAAALGTVAFAGITYGALVKGALLLGYAAHQRQKAKREARRLRDAYNASLTDRNVTVAEAAPAVRHIYGRATVGGAVVALFTRGDRDQYKDVVIIWAGHECDAIEDVLLAGESLQLDANGYAQADKWVQRETVNRSTSRVVSPTGTILVTAEATSIKAVSRSEGAGEGETTILLPAAAYTYADGLITITDPVEVARWAGKTAWVNYSHGLVSSQVRVRHFLGAAGQQADAQLIADTAGLSGAWSASDRLDGLCGSIFTLDLNNTELQSGLPQFTARLRGKKVLDPRSGTVGWSDNSALCVYDFLRAAEYGKGVLPEQVEGVIAAANASDELITVEIDGTSVAVPRYTCNGSWDSTEDPDNVLEDLCGSMAGFAVPGGVWRVEAGVFGSPVLVLDDDLAAGSIAMVPAPSRADAWNGVKGQYIDPAQYNQAVDFEPHQVDQYVEDDGGEVWGTLNLPFTDSGWRARTLAAISLEQSRARTLEWTGTAACLRAQAGNWVVVNNRLLGLDGSTFRVSRRTFDPVKQQVKLVLREGRPSDYASVSNVVQPNPGVPSDVTYRVTPPSGLVLTSPAAGQIRIQVDPSPDVRVTDGGQLLIQIRTTDSDTWISAVPAAGSGTGQTITGLPRGLYIVQVDWQANTGQQSGQWLAEVVEVTQGAYAGSGDVEQAINEAIVGKADAHNPVFSGVVGLPEYELAELPDAIEPEHKAILVINSAAGPALCISDGAEWISQITGTAVA